MSVRSQILPLDGLRLFVLQSDTHHRPAILLLHGFASSALSWLPVIRTLGTERQVVAYDRPGFGLTRCTTDRWRGWDPYAPSAQGAIALELLDALQIEAVVLLGHSMGGRVAYELARLAPERVVGLVLVAPAWDRPSSPRVSRLLRLRPIEIVGQTIVRLSGPLAFLAAQRLVWANPPSPQSAWQLRAAVSVVGWDQELWRVTTASLAEPPAPSREPPAVPTLVVLGKYDRIVPNSRTQHVLTQWRSAGWHGRVELFERSGHLPHMEEFERFVAVVQEFLQEVEHGRSTDW